MKQSLVFATSAALLLGLMGIFATHQLVYAQPQVARDLGRYFTESTVVTGVSLEQIDAVPEEFVDQVIEQLRAEYAIVSKTKRLLRSAIEALEERTDGNSEVRREIRDRNIIRGEEQE